MITFLGFNATTWTELLVQLLDFGQDESHDGAAASIDKVKTLGYSWNVAPNIFASLDNSSVKICVIQALR